MKLFLKTGKELDVKDFQPKKKNLIKVKLHNCNQEESVWAVVNDKTKEKIKDNTVTNDYECYASLRNSAVLFLPMNSWGVIIPIKLNGSLRPDCNIAIIDFDNRTGSGLFFNKNETI